MSQDKGIQLGELLQQSKANNEGITRLNASLDAISERLGRAIESFNDRIARATRPDFATMWVAAGVCSTVIFSVGGIVALGQQREISRIDKMIEKADERHVTSETALDIKLQREQQLISAEFQARLDGMWKTWEERHQQVVQSMQHTKDEVGLLRDRQEWQTRQDVEELRQRRIKQ